jgi:hypothetical protein
MEEVWEDKLNKIRSHWSKKPVHTLLYSIIENKKELLFSDLVRQVKEILEDVSEEEINRS